MEREGSLRSSDDPSTGPYPEPAQSSPYHLTDVPKLISIFRSWSCLSKDSKFKTLCNIS
jgi:hypothetical protein